MVIRKELYRDRTSRLTQINTKINKMLSDTKMAATVDGKQTRQRLRSLCERCGDFRVVGDDSTEENTGRLKEES